MLPTAVLLLLAASWATAGKSSSGREGSRNTSPAKCTPFVETFKNLNRFRSLNDNDPRHVRMLGKGKGIEMRVIPPPGPVTSDGTTNDEVGDGSTLNHTATFLYGRLTFDMASSPVSGIVTAGILVSAQSPLGEIDIEVLGGDKTHWQTNIFRVDQGESGPLYGVFGEKEPYAGAGTVSEMHTYVIDWSPKRLQWSIDGRVARTLKWKHTYINGHYHYPNTLSRFQVGIWDASGSPGTSEWAHGPVNWDKQGSLPVTMQLKRVQLECPYG